MGGIDTLLFFLGRKAIFGGRKTPLFFSCFVFFGNRLFWGSDPIFFGGTLFLAEATLLLSFFGPTFFFYCGDGGGPCFKGKQLISDSLWELTIFLAGQTFFFF